MEDRKLILEFAQKSEEDDRIQQEVKEILSAMLLEYVDRSLACRCESVRKP